MGHMKKIFAVPVLVIGLMVALSSGASAHEGSIDLTDNTVSCKGISLYRDSNYRVEGRCDGLVYPYETTYDHYVLWAKSSGSTAVTRVAEVDKGYFIGNISTPFDTLYITAEQDSLLRKPSDKVIVSGKVTPFSFDKSQTTTQPVATAAPATTGKSMTVQSATTTASNTGSVIGKILTSLLIIILVIVGLAIGASLIFRSRGSVSAH